MVTESWMSGSEVLVTICSESLGYHRISFWETAVWNERRSVIASSNPSLCVGVEPGAVASFSRALSAQGQTLAELLCSVSLQVTESFLSKEVTCVVSSNREAKRGQARTREEKRSSPTSEGTKIHELGACCPQREPNHTSPEATIHCKSYKGLAQGVCRVESGASFGR